MLDSNRNSSAAPPILPIVAGFIHLLSVVTALAGVHATATEYHVDRKASRTVRFVSDAPIEDFEGTTELIDGYVRWSGDSLVESASPLSGSECYFEVQLNGLDTGIGLRNRHMREKYLETDKYPLAYFKGTLSNIKRDSINGFLITANGLFGVHGVEKPMTVEVVATPAGDGFDARTKFDVRLSDHNIDIPKFMFLKINELIRLEISFTLKPVETGEKE